jgi:murein DD-endopeptidase MepM/ murein hydrolase activator NlpD
MKRVAALAPLILAVATTGASQDLYGTFGMQLDPRSSGHQWGGSQLDVAALTEEQPRLDGRGGGGRGGRGGGRRYTVVSGDSLSAIAARLCGNANAWPQIFRANRGKIRDPNLIFPGQKFKVPCAGGGGRGMVSGSRPRPGPPLPGTSNRIKGPGRGFLTHLPLRPGSYRVSSGFGPRAPFRTDSGRMSTSNHQGVDMSAPSGTPIGAAGPGKVIQAGWIGGYGWAVYIQHRNGMVTRYGHMRDRPMVRVGQRVQGGQQIGKVGSTGNSTGPHLHFEVRSANGSAQNPTHYCRF